MKTSWLRGMAVAGLGLLTMVATTMAQDPPPAGAQPQPRPVAGRAEDRPPGDLPGPIDSLQDLEDTAKMLFKMADINNDNQISQQEAVTLGNAVVGGFFFAADANGDGTLSQDEARQARENLLRQRPILRIVLQKSQQQQGTERDQDPFRNLARLLDANQDRQIQAAELRQAVQTVVQGIYATADTNRDGQMSPAEINAAVIGTARAATQAAWRAADKDNNGALSQEEFLAALREPAQQAFQMLDVDGDGQISQQELQTLQRVLFAEIQRLRVPEPSNSLENVIESGRQPGQRAPAPNFGTPGRPGQTRPPGTAPAPGTVPPQPQPR